MRYFIFIIISLSFTACSFFKNEEKNKPFELNKVSSIYYTENSDFFFGSYQPLVFPDTTFTINKIEDEFFLPNEKTCNVVYNRINPYDCFLFAEILENGIKFKVINTYDKLKIKLDKLCQAFIVPHPSVLELEIDKSLRLEEIKLIPRNNGSYQLSIGDKSRGCLELNKTKSSINRSKEYEMMINKLNLK